MEDRRSVGVTESRRKTSPGFPGLILGLAVCAVFIVAIFTFQVQETEFAVRTTLDRIDAALPQPGLNFRWPYPIQKIYRIDKRLRNFDGNEGKIEETYTADGKNILIGVYVVYRVKEPVLFFTRLKTVDTAEERLNYLVRGVKNSVVGRHPFSDFINTDPAKMRLPLIESEILKLVSEAALRDYGIEVASAGIKTLGLPESITKEVFDRMKAERRKLADKYVEEGKRIASSIREEARKESSGIISDAEAEARRIRGEGDAKAAASYAAFAANPQLAAFLRKLEALRKSIDNKTTIILDTKTPPFDLLTEETQKYLQDAK